MWLEAAKALLGAPRWAMAEALAVLDHEHGGIEAYLRGPSAMTPERLDLLRHELLQSCARSPHPTSTESGHLD
jgi:hypothetical protein